MNAQAVGYVLRMAALFATLGLLGGCAALQTGPMRGNNPDFTAVMPPPPKPASQNNGAIYQSANSVPLFEDQRARHVGDILTVILNESTNANKSADTATSRDTSINVSAPTVLGAGVTYNGKSLLSAGLASKNAFAGKGSSTQSNQLSGTISVTVAQVLSNGNLIVQGEKWIALNQGREYVRFRGIVRSADITPLDTVLSTQVANAEIAYGGRGVLNDANREGWLAKFFNAWWPL
ncbi:flagellar basal body L-ring protein [Acidihalobacter yilgarnensis]|uniref:Flagellar L-ring protein n=1 Tax=Acidihalobacter yilgarnensis TaxID=2819280 RepID=A0A1D8IQ09_9GAMM|nr:flagellar basal body L-ring protein FlgH [Acidihalobacter yilgarnensis]AOU98484.1 flagellar basal body L-ring protein [Acidihalobacter yilgarnensis]